MTESDFEHRGGRTDSASAFGAAVAVVAIAAGTIFAACSSAQAGAKAATPAGGKSSTASTGRVAVEERSGVVGSLRPGETRDLAPGEAVALQGTLASVAFVRVVEDSRCARGVTCVWAGRARVEVVVRMSPSGPDRTVELEVGSKENGSVDVGARQVVAESLAPYPEANVPIAAGDYRLRVAVAASEAKKAKKSR